MERSQTPRVSQQARGAGQQQQVMDVNDTSTSESKRGLAAGMLRTPSPPVVRASSPNAGGGGGASLISWMKTALSLQGQGQGQGQGNQQSHDAVGGASVPQTDAAAAPLPAATPQLVASPTQERQTDRSNANRRSAVPPVRRPSTISTTSSGGKSSTMSRLSVSATQQTEDSEVDSEAEETFTPFAPASMPPALVKPTARAGGTTLSFARSASDGSDFYNQLEAEKERSAGAGAGAATVNQAAAGAAAAAS
ncbi:hypothetical protein CBOM_06016 [Ceraceosorus bombacis]|uniref:Uncharacterized protein n=1 Tax=Ceraceosorus bombacis TaxID=401625 RepID=A0A0P1BJ55_9BASI|nr:hypothetical protein CBOM_06016 [Ceraceosorus bombacis]